MASPAYMAAGKMLRGMLRGMPGGMPSKMPARKEREERVAPMVRKKRQVRKEEGGPSQAAPYSLDTVSVPLDTITPGRQCTTDSVIRMNALFTNNF